MEHERQVGAGRRYRRYEERQQGPGGQHEHRITTRRAVLTIGSEGGSKRYTTTAVDRIQPGKAGPYWASSSPATIEMHMTSFRRTAGLAVLLTAGVGCSTATDSRSPARDNGNVVASASAHRILMAATAAQDGDVGAACTANAEGNLDSCLDDGAGTSCTYTTTPGGDVLLAEVCSGYWSYTCANTGTEIDCAFVCADGSECSDRWSLEYELIASTCDYEVRAVQRGLRVQEDGTTLCTWNEELPPATRPSTRRKSSTASNAPTVRASQIREAADDTLHCALYDGDALLCEDVYTMDGEPVCTGLRCLHGGRLQLG